MDRVEPQKPKPTAKAKQTAGPSNLTRSKAKRTLHYDSDRSRSKAHQPPLKKQIRLGTEQVDKSVEIAFQNDLVLESLFRYMNRSELLSCRIVNKQWQYEATKELRRRKSVIRFSFESQRNKVSRDKEYQDICKRLCQCRGTPSLLSSFQVKAVAPRDLRSVEVGSLFIAFGNQMKTLTLHLNYMSTKYSFKNCSLTADLQNLLFCQAPNLEFLEIQLDFPFHWNDELQKWDSPDHHQNGNNEFGLLPNLKSFILSGTLPPKFFADVINAAVNLRSFGGDWSTCIKYLIGPKGRTKIHLLKRLSFVPAACYQLGQEQFNFELVESFLTAHKQNLKLESFDCLAEFIHRHPFFSPRYVSLVNQILECSSGSLQKLRIESEISFVDLPSTFRLPNLKEICFDCGWINPKWFNGDGFFPIGFNMNHSFPNVSSIFLLRCTAPILRLFVSGMEIEMTEPVRSVRRITMIAEGRNGSSNYPFANDFHHIFPNIVSISYADSAKYYKI